MQLVEQTFSRPDAIDRESKVIRGVKIIGRLSRNGREYSQAAIRKLAGMYEGVSVNLDHNRQSPNAERLMGDGFGMLRDVHVGADGAYGDLHYLESHPLAAVVLERAERMPESFGLSHSATGKVVRKDGRLIVEDIEAVRSVDIVREPATTDGLFESKEFDVQVMTIQEIARKAPRNTGGLELLVEMMDGGAIDGEAAVEVAPEASPDDQIKAAFRAAVIAAFDDDSLDMKATLAKIREILKSQEKLSEKPEPESDPEPEAEAMPEETTESKRYIATLEATNACLQAGVAADADLVESLAPLTAVQRKALLARMKEPEQKQPAPRPQQSRPLLESGMTFDQLVSSSPYAARN